MPRMQCLSWCHRQLLGLQLDTTALLSEGRMQRSTPVACQRCFVREHIPPSRQRQRQTEATDSPRLAQRCYSQTTVCGNRAVSSPVQSREEHYDSHGRSFPAQPRHPAFMTAGRLSLVISCLKAAGGVLELLSVEYETYSGWLAGRHFLVHGSSNVRNQSPTISSLSVSTGVARAGKCSE